MRLSLNEAEIPAHLRRFFKPKDAPCGACYVCHMAEVMRGVRRVLRDDGTLWLNVGDSYTTQGGYRKDAPSNVAGSIQSRAAARYIDGDQSARNPVHGRLAGELPEKNLMLIPERLAIAMQDDGWICRSRIAWAKSSAMPESVTDRPSSAWEHIWLFAKKPRYFWDAEAVRQKFADDRMGNPGTNGTRQYAPGDRQDVGRPMAWNRGPELGGANLRNFWLLGPEPFPESHFAVFPREVPKRAILAGTSAHGCCSACGAPWRRVVEREGWAASPRGSRPSDWRANLDGPQRGGVGARTRSLGWQPTCAHADAPVEPCRVFDPFAGSGTTLMVARALGRIGLGAEVSEEYCRMAVRRIQGQTPAMEMAL